MGEGDKVAKVAKPFRLEPKPFQIMRLDENPANHATFGRWCFVTDFYTRASAEDYIRRAEGPTQKLRVEVRQSGEGE